MRRTLKCGFVIDVLFVPIDERLKALAWKRADFIYCDYV
jgi:hypothetical protein